MTSLWDINEGNLDHGYANLREASFSGVEEQVLSMNPRPNSSGPSLSSMSHLLR
jgi:hypothetical protein